MTIFLGNHRVREKIVADSMGKKLPHALLISGPKGTGKYKFLKHLAEKIIEKPEKKFFPPEVMLVDELFQEGKHTNLEEISHKSFFDQSHRKKSRKKTDTIGVEDLEVFTKHLSETVTGEYKVLIIRDVERMTRETANKFLKTLEEPPAKTLFLMSTSAEKKLLPTFLSRVRREHFSLISENILQEFLHTFSQDEQNKTLSAEEQSELIHLAAGRGEVLLQMLDDEKFFETERAKKAEAENIFCLSDIAKMNHVEILAKKDIAEIKEIIFFLEKHLRMTLRGNLKIGEKNTLFEKITRIQTAKTELAQNGNKRMVLESLFLHL
jgi:DNA polymerase III gamma/tau subunit